MSEMYWITRLDGLESFFKLLTFLGILAAMVVISATIAKNNYSNDKDYEQELTLCKTIIKIGKIFVVGLVVGVAGLMFVPNTQEALIIYGVGGTIDYIKSNDKAKQLPDKAVEALDKYLDEINKKDKEK